MSIQLIGAKILNLEKLPLKIMNVKNKTDADVTTKNSAVVNFSKN